MPNEFKVKNGLLVSGSANINSSGSGVFTVDGTSGRLFQIDDSLSGSLFSVNTAAGLPIIEAFSDNTVRIGQFGQRALFISQSKVGIGKESALNGLLDVSGSITVTGSVSATNFTGSLFGTSSWAVSASWAPGGGAAFPYTGSAIITGSLVTTGSIISTLGLGNFIELVSTGSGNRPYIKLFDAGTADLRIYTALSAIYGNINFPTNGFSLYDSTVNKYAHLVIEKLAAVSGAIVVTNAGGDAQVNIASPSGFSNYVSFRENGVANRGVIGYANGTSYLQIRTNGATSMTTGDLAVVVDNTGSVGIGTTSPAYKLDVNGTARISGDTLVNSANGLTVTTTVSSTPATLNAGGSSTAALELQSLSARRFRILSTSATTTFEATNTSGFIMNSNLNVQGNITGSSFTGSFTGSLLGTSSFATSASQATTASYVLQAVSASFATSASRAVSASFATTAASATTASYILNAVSASFASTASSADNFTVRGTLTAQTIVVQTITSSTDFVTGSTRFGSLTSNTHQFTGSVGITGSLTVVGPVSASAFTGSLLGTASFSTTASYVLQAVSASFATSAANATTASYVLTAQTASFVTTAQTASYVLQAVSASFATTARTASYVLQAISASFATTAASATTASYVLQAVSASFATSAQTANTASYVVTAQTASFVTTAQTASYVLQAVSASFATSASRAVSASFATTAAFATNADLLDGAHLSILATTGSNTFIGNQTITGSINISGSAINLTRNGNSQTQLNITNTTAGTVSTAEINLTSTSAGQLQKRSSSTNTYKILGASDFSLYNATAGDIAIFNDLATGNIKFAGGGVSTPQLYLSSSGNFGIGTVGPTARLHVVGNSFLNGNVTLGSGVYYDNLNVRLGIGVSSPTQVLDVAAPIAYAKFTSTTGTNQASFQFTNTGGNFFLGIEDSAGSNFGATAYAGLMYHSGNYPIEFFPNATKRVEFKANGQVRFNAYTSTTSFTGTAAGVLAFDSSGNILTIATPGGGSGSPGGADTNIQFNDGGAFGGTGSFTFNKATSTVKIQGSGSVLLHITGSRGDLFRVLDSGSAATPILATISSGSVNVFTFTTSSLVITGSVNANIETDALHYGRIVATPTGTQNNYSPTGWNDADPFKSTTINISGTNSLKITGLAGGQAGRLAILKNTSTDRLIILEDSSSLSTATNTFDLRNPIFLLPNGSATLLYDGVDSRWQPLGTSGGIGFGAFFDNYDDFNGAVSSFTTTATEVGRFAGIASGTGASGQASTYLRNTTEKPFGIYQIDTGTTSTGRSHIGSTDNASVIPANGQAMFLCRIAVEALSDGTNEYQIFAGFHDAVGGTNVTDGVYWEYRRTSSTAWQGATANNSTITRTGAAGPTVNTNYIWLGIYINSTWSRATYFYSEDSLTWTISGELTTNLPTAARNTSFGVTINKTAGTTQRNCSIDLMAVRYDIQRG
jgi:hypothetical protein